MSNSSLAPTGVLWWVKEKQFAMVFWSKADFSLDSTLVAYQFPELGEFI